jgi:hypothetical protein
MDARVFKSVTKESEIGLLRAYWEHGDLDALELLVNAHRPMLVTMARAMRRRNGTSFRPLVEYGVMGLREAAQLPRPSETKKGKTVGFDPAKGNRFGTYARSYALKWMREALADDPKPKRAPELEAKGDQGIAEWSLAPSLRGILPNTPARARELISRESYFKPYRPWTLWNSPEDRWDRVVALLTRLGLGSGA